MLGQAQLDERFLLLIIWMSLYLFFIFLESIGKNQYPGIPVWLPVLG
jgi:hypothetical protein